MPTSNAARDQLCLPSTHSSTETYHFLVWVAPIITRRVSMLQEHAIYDRSDHANEGSTAEREDPLGDVLGDNPSTTELPCNRRSQLCEGRWRSIHMIAVHLNASIHSRWRRVRIPTATWITHCCSLFDCGAPKRVNSWQSPEKSSNNIRGNKVTFHNQVHLGSQTFDTLAEETKC